MFQYKKHDTTDDWADCQSQVISGKTYYYAEVIEHPDFQIDFTQKD